MKNTKAQDDSPRFSQTGCAELGFASKLTMLQTIKRTIQQPEATLLAHHLVEETEQEAEMAL